MPWIWRLCADVCALCVHVFSFIICFSIRAFISHHSGINSFIIIVANKNDYRSVSTGNGEWGPWSTIEPLHSYKVNSSLIIIFFLSFFLFKLNYNSKCPSWMFVICLCPFKCSLIANSWCSMKLIWMVFHYTKMYVLIQPLEVAAKVIIMNSMPLWMDKSIVVSAP